jgi:diguanylate cyclase (GGDEF)-like protein
MGGEEFMVAFACPRAACIEIAEAKAETLRIAIGDNYINKTEKETTVDQSGERRITASIGVAMLQPDRRHAKRVADTLFKAKKRADEALYHAKQNGRNRVAFYDRMPQATVDAVEATAVRPDAPSAPTAATATTALRA